MIVSFTIKNIIYFSIKHFIHKFYRPLLFQCIYTYTYISFTQNHLFVYIQQDLLRSFHLTPLQARWARAGCPGLCSAGFWISPWIGTPQPLQGISWVSICVLLSCQWSLLRRVCLLLHFTPSAISTHQWHPSKPSFFFLVPVLSAIPCLKRALMP